MSEHQYPASLTHGLSREEILNRLHNRLDEPRYEHCLRVEATAIEWPSVLIKTLIAQA